MSANQVLLDSAQAATDIVDSDHYFKLTKALLGVSADEILKHVNGDEAPGLLSPIEIEAGGKDQTGLALALNERLIVAWSTGTFRIKHFSFAVDRDAIDHVTSENVPGKGARNARDHVTVVTGTDRHVLLFPFPVGDAKAIAPVFAGFLDGSVTLDFGSGT